jgi:hypothetical protein
METVGGVVSTVPAPVVNVASGVTMLLPFADRDLHW